MKNKKIIAFILILFISISNLSAITNINAASISLDVPTTVTVGDTITAKIVGKSEQWNLTLKANGTTIANSNNLTNADSEIDINASGTYKTTSTGTVTFTLTGDYSYTSGGNVKTDDVDITKTVTVIASETTPDPTPKPEPEPTPQEPTFKSTNKIVYANGDINLRASWSTSSAKVEIKKGTELKLTGTSTEKVNGYVWYRVEYNGQTKYVSSSLITETKPEEEKPEEKSSNANLSKLTVTPSGLTPEFSKDVKEYTLTIGSDIEKIDVSATPEDEKATVKIEGNTSNIKEGDENIVTIKVTAEDGTVNTYKITVTKTKKEQLKLKTLSLNGIELSPEFSQDIYEYKVDIKDIDKLEIEAIANRDDATVEVVGNSNFNEGENIITIMVKSQDESEIVTYQIIANKSMSVTNNESNSIKIEDYALYIVIALIILVLIILVIIIIINKKKKQNIDGEYYTGLYNQDKDKDEEIKETENNEDIYEENNDENVEETKRKKTRKKDGKHF